MNNAIELEKQLQIKINSRFTLNCVIIHTKKALLWVEELFII